MVQAVSNGGQTAQPVAHGAPRGQLDEDHHGKLLLETKSAGRLPSFVPVFEFFENMSESQG